MSSIIVASRQLRRPAALLVALWALMLLVACGGDPEPVALSTLVGREAEYDGQRVEVHGVVRAFDDPDGRYYVVEDAAPNRVRLSPTDRAAPFDGREVRVTGRFTFREDEGRRIAIDEIEAATAP
jgi:hypothetical protein